MRILLLDHGNISDALSQVLIPEGHDVFATNSHYGTSRHGTTTVGFVEDFSNVLHDQWDLVVSCNTYSNNSGIVERFRRLGVPTIGAGQRGFLMERKDIGRRILAESKFECPRWEKFDCNADAIDFLKAGEMQGVVVKYVQSNRPQRTMVCHDVRDAILFLHKAPDGPLVLEGIVRGVEIAFSAYWDGKKFVQTVTNFEHKHMFPGDMGILVPEMGTLAFYDPMPRIQELLDSLLWSELAQHHFEEYRGIIDVNCIVDERKVVYALEFTCRYGVPISDIMTSLLKDHRQKSHGAFLQSVAVGESEPRLLHHWTDFAVGANLVTCGYGYHEVYPDICNVESRVDGWDEVDCHMTLGDVRFERGELFSKHPWVACVTGNGSTLQLARSDMVKNANRVRFQDKVFREDIGAKFAKQALLLHVGNLISERTVLLAN